MFPPQVRAEKPAWYQAIIGGALLRTLDFVAARSAEYLGYLEKGQLPPARLTLTAFEEAFVLDGARHPSTALEPQKRALHSTWATMKGASCHPRASLSLPSRRPSCSIVRPAGPFYGHPRSGLRGRREAPNDSLSAPAKFAQAENWG